MAGKVIDKDLGYRDFVRRITEAAARDPHVTVGIHAADDETRTDDEPSNVDVGFFNEFGTATVPERSFLRSTMDKNKGKYGKMVEKGIGRWIDGTASLEIELGRVGAIAKADVQRTITKLKTPPNAPSTIARKGSSNPLIDTGQLRAAIDFEVKIS